MREMQYESAATPETALRLLNEAANEAKVIAGGTNMAVYLKDGTIRPRLLVDISRIPGFRGLCCHHDQVTLKPNCTIAELLQSPELTGGARLLPMAAAWFAGPSVRNRATVAGNIADASPAADMVVPLLTLDAIIEISRHDQIPRLLPIQDLAIGPHQTALAPNEIITSLAFHRSPGARTAYYKLARRDSMAVSIISLAILVECREGLCHKARIAVGAASPVPFRALEAEQSLLGEALNSTSITRAAILVRKSACPISDIRGSSAYRAEVIEILVRRLLEEVSCDARQYMRQ